MHREARRSIKEFITPICGAIKVRIATGNLRWWGKNVKTKRKRNVLRKSNFLKRIDCIQRTRVQQHQDHRKT